MEAFNHLLENTLPNNRLHKDETKKKLAHSQHEMLKCLLLAFTIAAVLCHVEKNTLKKHSKIQTGLLTPYLSVSSKLSLHILLVLG